MQAAGVGYEIMIAESRKVSDSFMMILIACNPWRIRPRHESRPLNGSSPVPGPDRMFCVQNRQKMLIKPGPAALMVTCLRQHLQDQDGAISVQMVGCNWWRRFYSLRFKM